MAGIGDDIRDVLQELGTPFTIYRIDGTIITGECMDYDFYADQSTEFIRQFCYSGDFQYDSQVKNGDIITFGDKYFLIMNVRQTLFEREGVDYTNYFIECNTLGKFSRQTPIRGADYKSTVSWTTLHDNIHGVQTESEGMGINSFPRQSMDISLNQFNLYTQNYKDIRVGDRWYPSMNDLTIHYKIVQMNAFRFPEMLVCRLEMESRE